MIANIKTGFIATARKSKIVSGSTRRGTFVSVSNDRGGVAKRYKDHPAITRAAVRQNVGAQRRGCADGEQARAAAPSQDTLLALREIFFQQRARAGRAASPRAAPAGTGRETVPGPAGRILAPGGGACGAGRRGGARPSEAMPRGRSRDGIKGAEITTRRRRQHRRGWAPCRPSPRPRSAEA